MLECHRWASSAVPIMWLVRLCSPAHHPTTFEYHTTHPRLDPAIRRNFTRAGETGGGLGFALTETLAEATYGRGDGRRRFTCSRFGEKPDWRSAHLQLHRRHDVVGRYATSWPSWPVRRSIPCHPLECMRCRIPNVLPPPAGTCVRTWPHVGVGLDG